MGEIIGGGDPLSKQESSCGKSVCPVFLPGPRAVSIVRFSSTPPIPPVGHSESRLQIRFYANLPPLSVVRLLPTYFVISLSRSRWIAENIIRDISF